MRYMVRDTTWIRQAFMLPEGGIDPTVDAIRRIHTTADYKYTDTTIGGNFPLNPLPQFTRYADIKRSSVYKKSKGMGRFYSEAIDDHAQTIHFRLGVPKFNALSRFFGDFYNVEASTLARTGRSTSLFFDLGKAAGMVVTLPLMPILLVSKVLRFFLDKPASKYYYLKPAMPLYWNAVSSMVNAMAVNMGVIPRVGGEHTNLFDDKINWTKEDISNIRKMLPEIVREDGGIDIYAVSTRAQRLANAFNEALEKELERSSSTSDLKERMSKVVASTKSAVNTSGRGGQRNNTSNWVDTKPGPGFGDQKAYIDKYLGSADGQYSADSANASENDNREQSWIDSMSDFFHGERRMGADFVTFRVDHTGTNTESFSNSTKPAGIKDTINGQSANARDTRFSLAEGNIGDDAISKTIGGFVSATKDFVAGVGQQLSISGIAALAGSAFVDIPDMWGDSTADVGRTTFTIPLRAPYGHPYSRLQNILIPMAALMAMALPLSTGKQSYTSPFLLEMFNQGRTQIRLGMIESISFTRGVGETGWLQRGQFMGVDCNITVVDLSTVVHMPINPGFDVARAAAKIALTPIAAVGAGVTNALGGNTDTDTVSNALLPSTFDDDNKYTDYLAVLGSLPMEAQINTWRKLKLRLTLQSAEFKAWKSPAHLANWAMGTFAGEAIKAVSLATARE